MTSIRSRKHSAGRYIAALAVMSVIAPLTAHAADAVADAAVDDRDHHVEPVTIKGRHDKYKADTVSSPKKTQPLVDTAQTISVIKQELLDEQGAVSLTDALRNTPGITMQLGENGSTSAGDTFQLRGFSAQNSLFLDGVRDLGAISRDTFNVEQIEIAKGPAGADTGRGASTGYINLVSKQPTLGKWASGSLSAYSQGGLRGTLDSNIQTGATSAFRLNVMDQSVDTAGRSFVKRTGFGIAPAYAIGLGTPTVFSFFGQFMKQDNVPDGGLPTIGEKGYYSTNAFLSGASKVDRENYYGSRNDAEKVESSMLTAKVTHTFEGGAVLTNTSRYGTTTMNRSLTGINGITATSANPATWTLARTRQGVDQDNSILFNQTNLSLVAHTGGIEHDLAIGAEVGYESRTNKTLAIPTTTPATVIPAANLYTPNVNDALPPLVPTGVYTDGNTTTVAAYVFDTIKLTDQWRINAGARLDNYTIKSTGAALSTAAAQPTLPVGTLIPTTPITGTGNLLSWNLSLLYKPTKASSLYVAYGNSLTPPGGDSFSQSTSASSIANPSFDPQENNNLELGGKWDVFDKRLSLTGAWYQTVATGELAEADPPGSAIYVQVGKRKVDGFEFNAVGVLTRTWHITAGIQTLHTEIERGTTGNSAAGAATRWSPDLTATVWTTWKPGRAWTLGIGGNYTSEQKRVVDPAAVIATSSMPDIPAYFVTNAMASYNLSRRVELQLNVYNLLDKHYISTLNNSGARMTLGTPLSATLTARVKF